MQKFTFILKAIFSLIVCFYSSNIVTAQSGYIAGDFHQHSTYTDGSWSIGHMISKNVEFGLDWWANSEHGGAFNRNGAISGYDFGTTSYLDELIPNPIMGDYSSSNGHQNMWRWQTLKYYSFAGIYEGRQAYPSKTIIQGYEMNVPGHEHGSVGIISGQFDSESPNATALAEFEYKFDNNDRDQTGGASFGWTKSTEEGHARTLEAIDWLQNNYAGESWLVPAHPERKKKYTIADFRDMNNAGPDVCFGFESMPGHQKSSGRGGYSKSADGAGCYGGCGIYAAKVGGLWDAMLSEGRNFWLFANSDFHHTSGDFYPGEYQKTYTFVEDKTDAKSIVKGLRSGNTWVVEGDLIDMLDFKLKGMGQATMGETLDFNKQIMVEIIIRDPETNNNFGQNPELNHVDLIMGKITGKLTPDNENYNVPEAPETKVIARFDNNGGISSPNGITSIKWIRLGNNKIQIKYILKNVDSACYFRLRGTNQGLGIENETDANGNPLNDYLMGTNTVEKATKDLWFYSNPIFAVPANDHSKLKSATIPAEKESLSSSEIYVYPNPAKNKLHFANIDNGSEVKVFNISGKLIFSELISNNSIDVSKMKSGVYFAHISNGNTVNKIKFIIE